MNEYHHFDADQRAKAERRQFLKLSIIVEGGISVVALVAGWVLGLPVWTNMKLSWEAFAIGAVATIPLLIMLRWTYLSPSSGLIKIHEMLQNLLGRSLASCRWLELCVVASLAGISEECLFRGLLEPLLGRWSWLFGLIVGNVIFGLCHAVTPTYFIYATLIGCYLSLTLKFTEEPNLVIPITVHALYDLVAFVVIRNEYLASQRVHLESENEIAQLTNESANGVDS